MKSIYFICVCPFGEFSFELQSQQIFCCGQVSLFFNRTRRFLIKDDSKFLQALMIYALKVIINELCEKILENECYSIVRKH